MTFDGDSVGGGNSSAAQLSEPLLGQRTPSEHSTTPSWMTLPIQQRSNDSKDYDNINDTLQDDDTESWWDRFTLWIVLPVLVFAQFAIYFAVQKETPHKLQWTTVNASIVLFVVASYIFRRTVAAEANHTTTSISSLNEYKSKYIKDAPEAMAEAAAAAAAAGHHCSAGADCMDLDPPAAAHIGKSNPGALNHGADGTSSSAGMLTSVGNKRAGPPGGNYDVAPNMISRSKLNQVLSFFGIRPPAQITLGSTMEMDDS